MMDAGTNNRTNARRRLAETGLFLVPRPQVGSATPPARTGQSENHARALTLLTVAAAVPLVWMLRALVVALHAH